MNLCRCCLVLCLSVLPTSALAQEWGTVKGRLVFGGDAPEPVVLEIERDADVCGKNGLIDESSDSIIEETRIVQHLCSIVKIVF